MYPNQVILILDNLKVIMVFSDAPVEFTEKADKEKVTRNANNQYQLEETKESTDGRMSGEKDPFETVTYKEKD